MTPATPAELVEDVIDRLLADEEGCSCSACEARAVVDALAAAGWLRDTPTDSLR